MSSCQFPEHHGPSKTGPGPIVILAVAALLYAGATGLLDAAIILLATYLLDVLAVIGAVAAAITAVKIRRARRRRRRMIPAPVPLTTTTRRAVQIPRAAITAPPQRITVTVPARGTAPRP